MSYRKRKIKKQKTALIKKTNKTVIHGIPTKQNKNNSKKNLTNPPFVILKLDSPYSSNL